MSSTITIRPDSTMAEVEAFAPGARRALFARYHIGGCQSCGFQADETLAQVCARNDGIDVAEAISHIEASHQHDLELHHPARSPCVERRVCSLPVPGSPAA